MRREDRCAGQSSLKAGRKRKTTETIPGGEGGQAEVGVADVSWRQVICCAGLYRVKLFYCYFSVSLDDSTSGTMKSPECVAQFVCLSLHQIALLRFLLTALLLPSLIHTSQFLICVSLSLSSPCVFTPSLFTPPSPLLF